VFPATALLSAACEVARSKGQLLNKVKTDNRLPGSPASAAQRSGNPPRFPRDRPLLTQTKQRGAFGRAAQGRVCAGMWWYPERCVWDAALPPPRAPASKPLRVIWVLSSLSFLCPDHRWGYRSVFIHPDPTRRPVWFGCSEYSPLDRIRCRLL